MTSLLLVERFLQNLFAVEPIEGGADDVEIVPVNLGVVVARPELFLAPRAPAVEHRTSVTLLSRSSQRGKRGDGGYDGRGRIAQLANYKTDRNPYLLLRDVGNNCGN